MQTKYEIFCNRAFAILSLAFVSVFAGIDPSLMAPSPSYPGTMPPQNLISSPFIGNEMAQQQLQNEQLRQQIIAQQIKNAQEKQQLQAQQEQQRQQEVAQANQHSDEAPSHDQYPTDTDMKAAYCTIYWRNLDSTLSVIPIEDGSLSKKDSLNIVRLRSLADANFKKAGSYISNREQYIDIIPIKDAIDAASRDIESKSKCVESCGMQADSCAIKWRKSKKRAANCEDGIHTICANFCDTKEMKECITMSFMPY